MYKGLKVLAIVGGYNEEGKIGWVVKNIPPFVDKILIINDGSTDNTEKEALEAAKGKNFTLLRHEHRSGPGKVLKTGMEYAIKNNYDIIVHVCGDAQDDPKEIIKLLKPLVKGYDLVQGSRYLKRKVKGMPLFRKLTTKLFTFVFNFIAKSRLTDASNGFRAYKAEIVKNIDFSPKWLDGYELEPYMLLMCIKKGYKIKEVQVSKYYPKIGYSKMRPLIDWFNIVKPLIKFYLKKFRI
jgi:dolichol-phosphate mannosyltransferase